MKENVNILEVKIFILQKKMFRIFLFPVVSVNNYVYLQIWGRIILFYDNNELAGARTF